VPTYIFVFDDVRSFEPYGLLYEGKAKEIAGYFSADRYANNAAILGHQYSTDVSSTVYHEYIHYVLSTNQPELPLWMNEGLAELYSTFDVEDGVASIGYPIGNHLIWLRNNPLIPLADLISMDRDSPDYNEGHRRGVFYAQSWALTHMLVMGSSDGENRATSYSRLLQQGVDKEQGFRQAMGGTYKEIEKELNRYVRGSTFSYSKMPLSSEISATSTVTEMAYPDVLCRLGNLLTALGPDRLEFAASHFNAALEIDPNFGPAIAGLGRIDELAGRSDAALARYERAAELAPDDFMANFLLGNALFNQREEAGTDEQGAELVDRIRASLRRAAYLRPSFAEAWSMLGTTYSWDSEPDDFGIKAMEQAHLLLPKRGDVGYNLVLLHVRRDRLEDARNVVARMKAAGVDEDMVRAAKQLADNLEASRADTLLRIEQADAGGSVGDAAELAAREARNSAERREFTDRYNEAVDLVNGGDFDAAIEILEPLVTAAPTPELTAMTKLLLDDLKKQR
jgi:tetratricopeptide (TPR) repeat protein